MGGGVDRKGNYRAVAHTLVPLGLEGEWQVLKSRVQGRAREEVSTEAATSTRWHVTVEGSKHTFMFLAFSYQVTHLSPDVFNSETRGMQWEKGSK